MPVPSSTFWQDLYACDPRPAWDLDGPTPLLPDLLACVQALGLEMGPTIAVPGCGFGHDAAALARLGYRVTGLDLAPAALEGARARYGHAVEWVLEDWIAPQGSRFDALFDHTCFAAIEPARRAEYAAACGQRLRPGGLWLCILFHTVAGEATPPWPLEPGAFRILVEGDFEILHLGEAEQSPPGRTGQEYVVVARRRP